MTTYFKKFPLVDYTLDDKTKQAVNILTSVLPRRLNVDRTFVFQRYLVSSGERPEETADRLYKNPDLWWVSFVINGLINPYLDWRMADEELEMYCKRKYDDIHEVHHYININTDKIVDEVDTAAYKLIPPNTLPSHIVPVTNFGYETNLNTEKGEITVVNPRYISQFVDSYMKALEGR